MRGGEPWPGSPPVLSRFSGSRSGEVVVSGYPPHITCRTTWKPAGVAPVALSSGALWKASQLLEEIVTAMPISGKGKTPDSQLAGARLHRPRRPPFTWWTTTKPL